MRVLDVIRLPSKLDGKTRLYRQMLGPTNRARAVVDILSTRHSRITDALQNTVGQPTPEAGAVSYSE